MHDPFGRAIRYLRLSITPACSMHCIYCRPAGLANEPSRGLLTPSELEAVVRHLVEKHGLRKVRLTGGEPTARGDVVEIVERLSQIDGIADLAMTTNGLALQRLAVPLRKAGLHRVNISLDSLDAQRFAEMTGLDGLERVKSGIEAAIRAGLAPVKLNTVVVRGQNDHELPALVRFAADRNVEIRFIELMPMGPLASSWEQRYVSTDEMCRRLECAIVESCEVPRGSSAARRMRAVLNDGTIVHLGFVSAMSCPFCDQCDRIRIAADGSLFPCLMDKPKANLLDTIRPAFDAAGFDAILVDAVNGKSAQHPATGFAVMTHIGG